MVKIAPDSPLMQVQDVKANGTTDKAKASGIEINIGQSSEAAEATKKTLNLHIEMTIENMMYDIDNAKTPKEKAKLKKQLETFKTIYKNTKCEIQTDGSIQFTINGDANFHVKDFKKAFGIVDGSLQGHLQKVHDEAVKKEEVGISDESDGYNQNKVGAKKVYSDGYTLEIKERKYFGFPYGTRVSTNYDDMFINYGEKFTIQKDQIR